MTKNNTRTRIVSFVAAHSHEEKPGHAQFSLLPRTHMKTPPSGGVLPSSKFNPCLFETRTRTVLLLAMHSHENAASGRRFAIQQVQSMPVAHALSSLAQKPGHAPFSFLPCTHTKTPPPSGVLPSSKFIQVCRPRAILPRGRHDFVGESVRAIERGRQPKALEPALPQLPGTLDQIIKERGQVQFSAGL